MKLLAYWLDKPTFWFAQAEAQFALANVNTDLTKYYHVISQLDIRAATELEDIFSNPPAELPYTNLRQKLIERLSSSEEQRVRQLLHDEELGDRKPSQFLRHLKLLVGPAVVQPNRSKSDGSDDFPHTCKRYWQLGLNSRLNKF